MAIVKKISELTPKGSNLGTTDLLIVGVDNGTDYDLKSVTGAQLLGTVVSQTITDSVTTKSPSENAVFDALALKVDKVAGSRLITSAEGTILSNTSGTNTGDQTLQTVTNLGSITTNSISSQTASFQSTVSASQIQTQTLANSKRSALNSEGSISLSTTGTSEAKIKATNILNDLILEIPNKSIGSYTIATTSDLTSKVDANTAITAATKTKITYDSKGLVTSGADATTSDISDSLNKRYVTDANLTTIGNTSGTNTGDQDLSGYQLTSGKDATSGYVGISPSNSIVLPIGRAFVSNNVTPNQIAYFDNSGNLLTLSVATYPSISELSYVKGVTSAIQTQLNAKVTGSGTSSGTNTGDQIISDATITTTDITTNNFTTAKHGFVPKGTNVGNFLKDDGTWGTPASGSSGGIWGIANSSGVYTYYATWALAVAAATSGKCIELFADITENSVSYTLKNGVNINGNGHSVSFSVVDGFIATSSPTICEINNIVINQATASVNGLYINANGSIIGGNATFNSNNASSYGVFGRSVVRIYGFNCNGYNPISASGFFSPNAIIDNVYVESLGGGVTAGTLSNSIIKTSAAGNVPVSECGTVNNCYIYSNGGNAVVSTGTSEVNNCTIISVTSRAVTGNGITFNNCWIKSSANNVAGNGKFNNCTLIASTTAINPYLGGGLFNNCTITANASAVFSAAGSSTFVNNCNVICNYNNVAGYAFTDSACYVNNSVIQLANASATAFYSSGALTMYLANNSIKGTTNLKNANVTNGQTNTADAQGNVILN